MSRPDLGVVRLALTLTDPAAPVAFMYFLTIRCDMQGVVYSVPISDESVREECEKAGLSVSSWRKMLQTEVAPDREFRNAVVDSEKGLTHDIDRVKQIALGNLRKRRNAKLDELDREYMKALGRNDVSLRDAIELQRETLRNLPEVLSGQMSSFTSLDEVKESLNALLNTITG